MKQNGAAIFAAKCASCHTINGVGGTMGPNLSKIGGTRDANYLLTKIEDPKATNKESKMPSFKEMSKPDKDALVAYLQTLK
jgi:putative heme-binding domain-containing protein